MRIIGYLIVSILCLFEATAFAQKIVAHRGGAGTDLPESSIAAFTRSIKNKVKILETDLHLTKDNQIVLYHDPYLFNDKKLAFVNLNFEEAVTIAKSSNFDLIKLSDLATLVHESSENVSVELEIKYHSPWEVKYPFYKSKQETVGVVLNEVVRLDLVKKLMLSSFDEEILKMVRMQMPQIPLKFLYRGKYFGNRLGNIKQCTGICFWPEWKKAIKFVVDNRIEAFSPAALHLVHPVMKRLRPVPAVLLKKFPEERPFQLSIWTVNKVDTYEKLKDMHIDDVITDFPTLFIK